MSNVPSPDAPIPAEAMARLSGLELFRHALAHGWSGPTMSKTLNFRLVEVDEGRAVFEGEPTGDMLNPLGTVHGGFALTLIDSAAGCAAHTLLPAGVGYTTVETKANLCRAIRPDTGVVRCEGRVLSPGRQIMLADARLTDREGRLLAHGTSTLIVLQPR